MPTINTLGTSSEIAICNRETFIEAIKKGDDQFLKTNYYPTSYYELLDNDDNSILHLAAESGNPELVKIILDDGFKPDRINKKKQTPLHIAAGKADSSIISLLLGKQADPNLRDVNGSTSLHLVCRNFKNIELMQMLLQAGAKANSKDSQGFSPLVRLLPDRVQHFSKHEFGQLCTAMNLLMEHGARDQFRYEFGFDDFVTYGDPEHVEVLINTGVQLESRCHKHTPLLRAASLGRTAIAELLLQRGANIGAMTTDWGCSALHLAATNGHLDTVRVLLAQRANPNTRKDPLNIGWLQNRVIVEILSHGRKDTTLYETPFHDAVKGGYTQIVAAMIEGGAGVNTLAQEGTPLHYAINGITSGTSAFKKPGDHIETIKLLLDCRANITAAPCSLFERPVTPFEMAESLISSCADDKRRNDLRGAVMLLTAYAKAADTNSHSIALSR